MASGLMMFVGELLRRQDRPVFYSPLTPDQWPRVRELLECGRADFAAVQWDSGLTHVFSTINPRTALVSPGKGAAVGFAFMQLMERAGTGGAVVLSEGWAQEVRRLARQVIEELDGK